MLVSVALCTWNRADSLDRTLAEIRKLEIPPGVQWELLVVNNNCTDTTDDVLHRHAEHLPIRRLFEKQQGLSAARNCALFAARGELILWTDDDVLVDARWLAEYVEAAAAWPDVSFFGGPITPHFTSPPKKWIAEVLPQIGSVYAARDDSDEPFALDSATLPFGPNWAARTDVQRRYPYDTRFGRRGYDQLRGSETTVLERMHADGLKGRWVPTARVLHHVEESQQTRTYVRRFYFNIGKRAAMCDRDRREHGDARSRFWLVRQALKWEARYRLGLFSLRPRVWIEAFKQSSYYWGRLLG